MLGQTIFVRVQMALQRPTSVSRAGYKIESRWYDTAALSGAQVVY